MTTVLVMLAALSAPGAAAPANPCTPLERKVAGQEIYCCTTVTRQQCCSPKLDDNDQPAGCDCHTQ